MRLTCNVWSCAAAVCCALLGGVAVTVVTATSAYAQVAFDQAQTSAFATSVTTAITDAKGDKVKVTAAIVKSVKESVENYGATAAGPITSTVIAVAEKATVDAKTIGTALGQAASELADAKNMDAANAIATTLANEGSAAEIAAFVAEANLLGHPELAALALARPQPTREIGSPDGNGRTVNTNGLSGSNAGCVNPSCAGL